MTSPGKILEGAMEEMLKKLDRIIALLEWIGDCQGELKAGQDYATEQAQLATHRDGCKCGGH
jgi:hypothetical protein